MIGCQEPPAPWHKADSVPLLANDDCHVWYVPLDSHVLTTTAAYGALGPKERARAERFHRKQLAARFVAAHGALRAILSAYVAERPAAVTFVRDSEGQKPCLASVNGTALRFNLSHSGSAALVAVSRAAELGVDIEMFAPVADIDSLAEQIFSESEASEFRQLQGEDRLRYFLLRWTMKEAVLKATGKGLAIPPDCVALPAHRPTPVMLPVSWCGPPPDDAAEVMERDWWVQALPPPLDALCALAADRHDIAVQTFLASDALLARQLSAPESRCHRPLSLDPESWIATSMYDGGRPPLIIEPRLDGIDVASHARQCRPMYRALIDKHAALLLRGFHIGGPQGFRALVAALSDSPIPYAERSSPRTDLGGNVYSSTDYPAAYEIGLHCENSYQGRWPMKIFFYCAQPAASGGRTPIVDCRQVLASLDPSIIDAFERYGIRYERTFSSCAGLTWQDAFQTADRGQVEAYCVEEAIRPIWVGGDVLRTQQVRPAIRTHPVSGERVWFNQATLFHPSSVPATVREGLLASMSAEELPLNACYGNGAAIVDATLQAVRATEDGLAIRFDWQAEDVLILDNMHMAHGREAYRGERRILVAMSEPWPPALALE